MKVVYQNQAGTALSAVADCPYLFCSAERAGAEVEYLMTVYG